MNNKYIKFVLIAVLVIVVLTVFALPNLQSNFTDSKNDKSEDEVKQVSMDTLKVNLSINGEPGKDLDIASGSNHCDLLNRAQDMQIINSLKMEYNETYQTYGVYKINDIGKDDEVWWVFTINGESPPAGCDGVKVNEGDQVVWEYLGD